LIAVNVLVTSAGSIPGVAVIEALRNQHEVPVRIVAADMDELSAGFLLSDARHVVPPANSPEFMSTIRRICQQESIAVVYPIIDEELQCFADHAASLKQSGVRVITNSPETVRITKDKILTAVRCREVGVAIPTTLLPEEVTENNLPPFPLIVKPRNGRGSLGVHKAHDREELQFYLSRLSNPIVQQFIEGTEYTIDVLTDFEEKLLSLVPKERILVKSGMQTKGRTVNDQQLMDFASHVVRGFRLFPRGNIQCIRDASGKIWLIEVNPKFAASLPFTVAAGVNAPLILLKLHLGKSVQPLLGKFQSNLVMLRVWKEHYLENVKENGNSKRT
jgi:carbamoyl-phosphate synthase large subunit